MEAKNEYPLRTALYATATNIAIVFLTIILTVFAPIQFYFVTWKTITMIIMPFVTLYFIIALWIKNPIDEEEQHKMGRPPKKSSWDELGIEEENKESNVIGSKNVFEPEQVIDEEYDFPNHDPELYEKQEEDIIIEEKPKQRFVQQRPQQMSRPQQPIRQTPQPQQMQRRKEEQQENFSEEEEIQRLMQKHALLKKQLFLVKQRLEEYGVTIR